jgi:Family of unknown function (DUF6152)
MRSGVCAILFLSIAVPAFSHHGTAASYDMSRTVTLTGVVSEYIFTNPHAQLYVDIKDSAGETVHWGCELNSPGNLRRDGWSKLTFKAGDQVTVSVNPSKAGTPYGTVDRSKPVMVNGKELPGRSGNVD